MVQAPDDNLFVTLGDHFGPPKNSRKNSTITSARSCASRPTAAAPPDNPFVGKPGALPEIWAYGLRNAQGLAFNPADGKLWEQEHGPMGGDEINIIEKGKNYGWPRGELRRQLRRHASRQRQSDHGRACSDRSGIGRRRSRRLAWRFTPAT